MKQPFDEQVETAQQRLEALSRSAEESPVVSKELLAEALAELSINLQELQVAGEELRRQNDELMASRQAVESERQRYQELFDFAPGGYLVTNSEGIIQEANRAAATLLGVRPDLLVGKPLIVFVPVEERRSFRARLTQLPAEPGPATPGQSWEVRLQPRDKPPFEAALTIAPMPGAEDQMVRFRWLLQDITERKQAEAALAEERILLRTLIDTVPDIIFVKDVQHRFILGNVGLARSLGVTTPDELLGKTDFDFHPSDLAAQYWADEEAIFQSGQPLTNREERVIYPGNEQHWHLTTKVPLRNGHGRIIGLVGMARDVTARKQVEEQLRQSHQFIQKAADASPHLIYIYDLVEQRNVYLNDRVSTLLGYTPAEIQTMGSRLLAELIHPDDHAAAVEHFNQLTADTAGGIFENEYRMKHSNGKWRWLRSRDVVFSRNAAGLPEQILGTVEDVTERRQLTEAYQMLVEHSLQGLAIFEAFGDFRLVFANPALARISGYTADELLSMSSEELRTLVHPQDRTPIWERAWDHLAGKPVSPRLEFRFICKGGLVRWVEVYANQIEYRGKPAVQVAFIDITERKRVEAEKERLFQEVSRQREQLRALTRQLAEAQEVERKQLARELHDQVGQNLAGLGLNLNIIGSQLAETSLGTGPIQVHLADSLALVDQITEQIRDVMANLRPPVLDDYGLAAALHWYGARLAERTGLTVTVQGQGALPRLATSVENTLFRIAQEALTNVAKHARAGKVTVTLEMEDGNVRLVIADDGCGFDLTCLADPAGSHGWGVLIMAERAEAVGGWFRIESSPGQGTQVIVEITPSASSEN